MSATPHSLVRELRGVPDLAELDDTTLLEIVGASINLFWAAGSSVFESGDPVEALYVVLSGRVRVTGPDDSGTADLGPGDCFGEHAVLGGETQSGGAVAVEDAELMVIPREAIEPIVADNPGLEQRIRQTHDARGVGVPPD